MPEQMYARASMSIEELELAIRSRQPDPGKPHEAFALVALEEAIAAARDGNFGVGACLVDPEGKIVERGHNHVFHPYPRSDLHAEMDTMTRFEERVRMPVDLSDYTLFTSLEPCPMCLTRLITAGVGQVLHVASDPESGMVSRLQHLTPVWVELANRQHFGLADVSPALRSIAHDIFLLTANSNTARLSGE